MAIDNYRKSLKEHLVYYILIDRYSGNFIFDVATTKNLFSLVDFLYFGWNKHTEEDHFWGLPLKISVPKRIATPELFDGLQKLGVEPFHPTSGFSSGIHIIKALEEEICISILYFSALHFLASIGFHKGKIYQRILNSSVIENKSEKWNLYLRPGDPRKIPRYEEFINAFPFPANGEASLPLRYNSPNRIPGKPVAWPLFLTTPLADITFSQEKLDKAEKVNDEAWEFEQGEKGLRLAYRALEISPYCADALNCLALQSRHNEEKLFLYRRAVQVGKAALGEVYFQNNTGHFWGLLESRPYMRALHGLADCSWKVGQRDEAITIYWEMLRLNPGDNQGIRYVLGFRLLEENREDELDKLFEEHDQQEGTCFMLYNKALHLFRKKDHTADKVLEWAIQSNRHVYPYLSGKEYIPYQLPEHYSFGEKTEAVMYATETKKAWENTPGAIEWLGRAALQQEEVTSNTAASIPIEQVLQEFLDDQEPGLRKNVLDHYTDIVVLLKDCLEGYGYQFLTKAEEREFYEQRPDGSEEELVFCRYFGPEKIVDIVGEFLYYFIPHKVFFGRDILEDSGTIMKKLALWMLEKEFIGQGQADYMMEKAEDALTDMLEIEDFTMALFDYVESQPLAQEEGEELDDFFDVVKVEPGMLHLRAPDIKKNITIQVPEKVSRLCREGWTINMLLVKTHKGWAIDEIGVVYPY